MAIGDAFPSDAALQDLIARPQAPKAQAPKFSTWGMITAAPGGAVAGLSEVAASAAEFAGGMAQNVPSSISGAFGRLPVMSGIQAAIQTGADLTRPRQGQFQNEVGTSLRNVAKDYMPDPITAHAAEQVVADLFRVGTKAIGAAVTAGPLAGAAIAGAEEGFTTAEKLAGQGVDIATRTKVGLMTGAIQAAGFAMPIAGQTVGQTAGLVALGGPLSFITQQEATRRILESADYSKLADTYDPLDPVGLALSTLIPAGFGALAMRGARAGLKGEPPKGGPDQETIDAARTALVAENVKTTNPVPVTDFVGTARHEQAYAKAIDQMATGERVEVADIAPASERMAAELEPRLNEIATALDEMAPAVKALEPLPEALPTAELRQSAIPVDDPQLDAVATRLEQESPGLMVQLEGMDAPAPLSEIMAKVRQEVADDLAEAPLVQEAANCFLRNL